jgi:putative FmdB family regulatory protein
MPNYEYQCSNCKNTFEKSLKLADRHVPCEKPCEKCGGQVNQIITTGLTRVRPTERPNSDWVSFTNSLKRKNPGSDFTTWGFILLGLILIFQEIEPLLEEPVWFMVC